MSERVPAQKKNSATPSQNTQSSSPLIQKRPFTDELYEPVARDSTISIQGQAQQPKIARSSLNWRNISIEAPSRSGGDAIGGAIQRAESEEKQDIDLKPEAPGIGGQVRGATEAKSPEEFSNSTISNPGAAQQPKIARSRLDWRNISVEAPSRGGSSSTYPGDVKQGEESTQSLQMQSPGAIQAKCSECQGEDEEKQNNESIQTKLTVGAPGDKYEQEADSMAAKVMTMPDSAIKQPIQRQTDSQTEAVQRQPEVNSITPLVQRSWGEEEEVQMKSGVERASDGSTQASSSIESRLASSKGGGSALPDDVRSFMEPRFGADFSDVRVHKDSNALQMNKELGAQAFAHGSDIYYGAGKSPGKDELTAHELTHTIQQTGGVQDQTEKKSTEKEENAKGDIASKDVAVIDEGSKQEKARSDAGGEAIFDAKKAVAGVTKEGEARKENAGEKNSDRQQGDAKEKAAKPEAKAEKAVAPKEGDTQKATDKTKALAEKTATQKEGAAKAQSNVAQNAVAKIVAQKEKVAGEKTEAATVVEKNHAEIDKAASESQKLVNTGQNFAPVPMKPMFATTEEGASALGPEEVLGKAKNGLVLYQTDQPEKSLAATNAGIPVRQIPEDKAAMTREQQRLQAEAAISQFMASGSQQTAKIAALRTRIDPPIRAAADQARAAVDAAIVQNQSAIINGIAFARTQAQTQAQAAKSQIRGQHSATSAAIRASTVAARQRLQAEYQSSLAQLAQTELSMAARIAEPFNKAAQDFRAAGVRVGQEAIQVGETKKGEYAKQSPPEPSNVVTQFLESFDRENYVNNWRQAKINAAGEFAAHYRDGLIQNAEQKATELLGNQPQVLQGMQELVTTTRSSLASKHTAALQQLDQAEQQALEMASTTLEAQLQGIDQNLDSTLASLSQMQATQLSQLNQTGQQQKLGIDGNVKQATAALNQGVNQASTNLQGAFQQFGEQARGVKTPNIQVINSVIAEAQGQLDGMIAATQTEIETGITNAGQGIVQQSQQTIQSLNALGQQAASQGATVAQACSTNMEQAVGNATIAFSQLQNGHTTGVNASADKAAAEFKQMSADVGQKLDGVIQNLNGKLGESSGQLENGLRGSLSELRSQIDTKANEAADKVQPAWKGIVKIIIDVVVTVAVTVAIAALAASGVGLVAAIGLAALIGAAGALVKQGANDLIDGKMSSWQTYATQAGFGAAGGVLQLVGLRGAEKASGLLTNKLAQNAARVGIESLGETGADISQRLAAGEKFSLAMLGVSAGTSLLGNAGGEALNSAFGKLGKRLGIDQIDNKALKAGGEFATDTFSETVTDVTSQVVFEGEDLSWQTVAQSAGTSALGNVTARGANRAYGDRLRNLGRGDRTSTDVPNLNQPLPPVGDISTPTPIIDPNTNQPVGQTPVSTPIIDPNTNQPVGQTPVSTPTKDEGLTQTPSGQIKDRSLNLDLQQTLTAALPRDLQDKVPINVDPDLPSNTVRVHYEVDANGLVTDVHMRVGPNASAVDIQLHAQTVRLMQNYSGFSGRIRILKERIGNWISKNGTPPVGSRAWEAKLEVEKLPRIIDERLERLSKGDLDADAQANLRADIENLQQQLTQHQQTLDEMDVNPGVGFVAADGNQDVKKTEQNQDSQPKKNQEELLEQLNAALNLRLSQKQIEYLNGNGEGNPLTTTQLKKLMEHTQNDWKQVKENYLKYPKLMEQLVDYRQAEVQKLINEVKAELKEDIDVVFQDKQGGGSIRQIAAGSTDLTSDYDIVFYSKNKAKAIQAVTLFNEKFRNKFEREAGFVFDTNVYTPGFLPDAAYSPTAARLSKLQDLQRNLNERDKNNQKLKEIEQALQNLDKQENAQSSQTKRTELETEITKLQAKIDSLNEKVTKLQTEVTRLTRNLKQKPQNLDSPEVVKQEIERFSAELDKQYQSEKKRNAAADSETDAVVVADQDVMSLAQQRRNMNEGEWNRFQEETLAGIEPDSELQKQTGDRFQKANEVYTRTRAELDAEIIAQNKRKDPEHADPAKRKVNLEDDVEAIKAQNPNAEIEASNLLYTKRLEEVKTILEQLEPLRDKRRNEPLTEQENERLNRLTVEWNKKQSEALIFANQAYYTGGAAQHVVGNQQMSLGRKLTPEEYLNSFNEQVSYALEHITDQEGLGHALWTSGKYLDRATDAVDQLTQLEKLLDSSPINIDQGTKARVKGLREMAQEMLNIKKGKEQYADLTPDQKGDKAIEVAQKYQTKYGFDLQDINGMRQELIGLSIQINQQVRRQGESYKAKNSLDPEGGNQQNSTRTSAVNPSERQSDRTDESKAEPSISNQKTSEGQEKTEENDNQEIAPQNHPGVELHNHFTGILKPAKIIELTRKQPSEILTDLWNNSSGNTKTVMGEVLKKNGILAADAESLNLSKLKVVEVTVLELLTATTIPFDETYRIRGSVLLSTTPEQQVRATLEQLKADGIKYAELQGGLPRGINPDQFKDLLKEYGLEVRFLEIISSERLASQHQIKEKDLIAKPERKALQQVGNGQTIGIDIAGAESRFTPEGMKRFKKLYEDLKQKAIEQNSTFVLRPHVGEGYPKRSNTGQLENSDEHRTIAQENLQQLINTLEELKANNQLSDRVIVRLGHATHATPEQLTRIQQLGIIVEANLTSNLVTRTVADSVEQNQVLLKFLFHDVKTVLNTDAGGVMSTSLQREYELAQTIMSRFNNNEIPVVVDNIHYYFSEIPDEGDREPGVEYRILTDEKRKNFDLDRLRKEAEGYSQKMQSNPNNQSLSSEE